MTGRRCARWRACIISRRAAAQSDALMRLLRLDLDFTLRHAGGACIGPWEEPGQNVQHYYVALAQLGALVHGRAFAQDALAWDKAEKKLRAALDRHWSEPHQVYAAMLPAKAKRADELIDASQLLAVLDADLPDGPHSALDGRVHKTQSAIEDFFARELPINRGRAAPALGRYKGDRYFGGGAWYVTTLAAAALYYRRARTGRAGARRLARARRRLAGDGARSDAGRRRAVRAGRPRKRASRLRRAI